MCILLGEPNHVFVVESELEADFIPGLINLQKEMASKRSLPMLTKKTYASQSSVAACSMQQRTRNKPDA